MAPVARDGAEEDVRARVAQRVVDQRRDDPLDDLGVDAGHHRPGRVAHLELELALGHRGRPPLGDPVQDAADLAASHVELRLRAGRGHEGLEDGAHLLGAAGHDRIGLVAVLG